MADSTPAQQQYPNLNPYSSTNGNASTNGNGSVENAKNSMINSKFQSSTSPPHIHPLTNPTAAQSTMDSIKNNNTVQDLSNGPMADKARTEANATKSEFSNLAASRTTPNTQTATGQNLTHYHSFFYDLLSWENPRATAISYVSIVLFIIVGRYVPIARYILKATYIVLGITAAAESAGKLILGQGVASNMRPKKYYTIPHEALESVMGDLTELANFFVIEFQRIVFAENIGVTVAAFTTALITYFLIKITPAWGMALIFTTLAYFIPLAYIQNRELIDTHVANAQDLISKQTAQVRDIAAEHTNKAMQATQGAVKDYSSKAQEMIGTAKKTAVDKGYVKPETVGAQKNDLPSAPKDDLLSTPNNDLPSVPTTAPTSMQPTHDGASDGLEDKATALPEKEPLLA